MYAQITPLDTVFFRDGRSFTMGQESWGESRFPPPPSVVYGALRTRYFAEHPDRLGHAATGDDPTGDARITSFHLRAGDTPLYPVPRDLVQRAEEDDSALVRTERTSLPPGSGGLGSSEQVLTHRQQVESVRQSYLSLEDLRDYLQGKEGPFEASHLYDDGLALREPKIGIRMDRSTRAADEGYLYRIGLHRLGAGVRFGVGVEGLSLAETGALKLGGEGKAARYRTLGNEAPVPEPSPEKIDEVGDFLLYLRTPAIFEQGWLPRWIDAQNLRGQKGPVTIQLRAAAVGKPGAVGGWDMNAGAPKPMHRTVPAGSVYHFSLEEGTPEQVVETFHDTSLSDHRPSAGFGRAFVGGPPSG